MHSKFVLRFVVVVVNLTVCYECGPRSNMLYEFKTGWVIAVKVSFFVCLVLGLSMIKTKCIMMCVWKDHNHNHRFIYFATYLPTYLPIYLSLMYAIYLSVYLSVSMHVSLKHILCLCLSACLSVCLCLSKYFLSVALFLVVVVVFFSTVSISMA